MRVYVAASLLDDDRVCAVRDELRSRGHEITYDWTRKDGYAVTWEEEERRRVASTEIDAVVDADVAIFLAPGGRGAHVEMGAALATATPVLMCCEVEPKFSLFYYHPLVKCVVETDPAKICDLAEGFA